ncbi:hypothetical protein KZZ52_52950 [Dactylosporangium sp. AC04546]|uniref:hypothetical protein n=1 Tax=Dactylosporangium sp. AC04546 TaxID=2862460 RepID=UPI001EDF6EB2|nr:hypothetical protein [Dactylosporangium sp. AC04546]WVK82564.1 hypothetical protein KZZ52_52950 [Dactylosporangium sp. AC04546]
MTEVAAVIRTVPKLGRGPAENEDSATMDAALGRFAVADGASTSARPEVWSRLLVSACVEEDADPLEPRTLAHLRERWLAAVADPALPWFAQAKLEQGADAAFVSLRLDPVAATYQATGVGDSCLFHLRADRIVRVGPVERAGGFNRFPLLLSSRAAAAAPGGTALAGSYRPGDVFALATDAMAHFLLGVHERIGRLPSLAALVRSPETFARQTARYRWRGRIANDDTTLCVVTTR